MGKRRQELDHKTREEMEQESDEEEDIIEENYEREPLRQDQLISIQSRKKLIAKRRVNDSTSSKPTSFTPFSSFASTIKPTELNAGDTTEEKPSVFSGFKGFSSMKPATDTSSSTSKSVEGHKLSTLLNGNGISNGNGITPQSTVAFSFTNKNVANGESEKTKIIAEESINSLNNISDKELLFLSDLNDLYQRHYGNDLKRSYKLPSDSLVNGNLHKDENTHDSSASNEAKYAFLLSELNKHCSKWISKHVEESPLVILTPIFIDYFNYLILLEKQFYPSTFNDKTKSNKTSLFTSTHLLNGTNVPKLNGTSEITILASNTKPVLEEKTTNKQLNGHQVTEKESQKYDEIDLTDEKSLNDSSKTFASFMNKVTQSQQPFNTIKLNEKSVTTTIVDSSPSKSSNLFSFNQVKSDDKLLNKSSDETVTPSSSSGSLFKFGSSNTSGSSLSSSSVSSNLSSVAETSIQKEVTLKKDLSSSNDSHSKTTTNNTDSFKSSLFSNSTQANTITPSFKFGSQTTDNSTPAIAVKRTNETTDSTPKNQNENSPAKITKEGSITNENPPILSTSNPSTTPSNFFSFLNKPTSTTTESTTSKPFNGFDSFKPATATGASSNLFTTGFNNTATPATNLLASNPNYTSTTTTTTTPTPFFSFQTNLSANKTTNLFGNSTFGKSDNPSPFGGSSVFGSATSSFGSAVANEGGDADDEPYEPPKPEVSDVKEEGSVYEKRLKLFFYSEKDKKFTDRGVGNIYLKPINDGKDTQLIIRADNSLANILLNVKLNKMFPISKEGDKNVSYLCMPNPPIPNVSSDVPCKFLFKVKTAEDASELFDKLNELKR